MTSRRRFVAGLGMATVAGMAAPMASSGAGAGGTASGGKEAAMDEAEFLLEPGLIHLNTGTFGLTTGKDADTVSFLFKLYYEKGGRGNPSIRYTTGGPCRVFGSLAT